jgi:hypothetical protein
MLPTQWDETMQGLKIKQHISLFTPLEKEIKEIKQYQKQWLQHVQRMDTEYQNKHCNTD